MIKNEVVKKILSARPNAFRYLAVCYGLDFEKPFQAIEITIPFTINSLVKQTGSDTGFVFFAEEASTEYYAHFTMFELRNGKIDNDIKREWNFNASFRANIDNTSRKSDFDTFRRNLQYRRKFSACYFISQAPEYIRIAKRIAPDYSERFFDISNYRTHYYSYDFTAKQNGKIYKVTCYGKLKDFFDKSGYYTENIKRKLREKLTEYKKQKVKQAKKEGIFDNKIEKVESLKAEALKAIRTVFLKCETAEELHETCNYNGYIERTARLINDCERFADYVTDAPNTFVIQKQYERIIGDYNKIIELTKGSEN